MAASVSPGVGARKSPRRNPVSTATYKMSWIGDKAGGDITFPTFRNNPQFDIFLKKPESMMVALTQDRDVELLEIGFYVVKGEGNGYPLPFIGPSDVIAQSSLAATKTVELKIDLSAHKDPTHFVVIPCTKQPGAESKFSISFSCPNPDGETKIEVIRQQWAQILVQGAWEIQGGTHNSPTFFDNPQYTLSISNYETNVHIRIEQQSPSDGEDRVGFYLIKENELSSFMYKAGARIGFTSSESAYTLLKAKPREKYFLVPALLNGKDGAEYLITVLSDHSVNLCPTEVRLSSTSTDEKILVSAEPTPDLKAALPPPGIFSRKHHLLNTTTAKGEWSVAKKSAGGCVNFSTWRLNPQFILTASRKSFAIMSLRQRPEDSKIPFDIGFYVVTRDETEEKRKRKMNFSPSQLVAKGVFQRSKEVAIKIDIDPSQSPYVVIPCTYQPNLESTFELNIASEGNQDWNLEICNDSWSSISLGGRWTKTNAGGCPEEATFGNNPQFQLKVLKPCDLQIVLTQPTAPKMNIIGFYVFKTVLGKVASVDDCDVAALGEFVDIEEVSARFKVPEMGMYTVVPCTLNASEEGEFELSVFASLPSCEIFVKLLPL